MTPTELAATLKPLKVWYEGVTSGRRDHSNVATGPCTVYIDPDKTGEVPSLNGNRAAHLGLGEALTRAQTQAVVNRFAEHGIGRFFVELEPCTQLDQLRSWLRELELVPFDGTGYPTLLRDSAIPVQDVSCDFEIRPLTVDDATAQLPALRQAIPFEDWAAIFVRAAAHPDVHPFGAFDGELLVAAAALFAQPPLGYLAITGTRPSYRRRGAQRALIAARLRHAASLELRWCVTETLYALQSSFSNLRHAGFEVSYEREMWMRGRG